MTISLQDIFNAAWQKFIVEDAPPAVEWEENDNEYQCRYLTKDGKKCAFGLCIPDEHPAQNESDLVARDLIKIYQDLWDSTLKNVDVNEIQYDLHDKLVNKKTGEWRYTLPEREKKYRDFAKIYELKIPGE